MHAIRPWLYIDKYREICNYPLLKQHRIPAMLQMAELVEQPGITTRGRPVEDTHTLSPPLLHQGMTFIREQTSLGKQILSSCGAKISRSATFAMTALQRSEQCGLPTTFEIIKAAHPASIPHPELWNALCHYFGKDIPWIEIA